MPGLIENPATETKDIDDQEEDVVSEPVTYTSHTHENTVSHNKAPEVKTQEIHEASEDGFLSDEEPDEGSDRAKSETGDDKEDDKEEIPFGEAADHLVEVVENKELFDQALMKANLPSVDSEEYQEQTSKSLHDEVSHSPSTRARPSPRASMY
jgi:hypothetical protein